MDVVTLPPEVARLLTGIPEINGDEQAFPFLTVDDAGYPHVALLSRRELEPQADGDTLLAVVASPRTRANLERDGRACLVAVDGDVAYSVKLQLVRSLLEPDAIAAAFAVVEHKADSAGLPLTGIRFRPTPELVRLEHWDRTAELLIRLAADLDVS